MLQSSLSNDALNIIKCALGSQQVEHISENPILLSCGHFVCNNCIESVDNHLSIKCNICDKVNTKKLEEQLLPIFDYVFYQNINGIFQRLLDHFKTNFEKCKNLDDTYDETINSHVDYLKDQVMVRIESLKIELDQLQETMNNKLEEIRKDWKIKKTNKYKTKFDLKLIEKDFEELQNNLMNGLNLTQNKFYKYQNELNSMRKVLDEIKTDARLEFIPSKNNLTTDFIGEIFFSKNSIEDCKIISRLKKNKYTILDLGCNSPLEMCELPNGNLILANFDQHNVLIYNKNMKLVKRVERIDNLQPYIIGIDANEISEIYLVDHLNCKIYKTDMDLNLLAKIGNGEGSDNDQFSHPAGLCFYNDSIFVCDYFNKRIQKFNSNLVYQTSHKLDCLPSYIKRLNNKACVRKSNKSIDFYNLDSFTLLQTYDGHDGVICVADRQFFEYDNEKKNFYCYNQNGQIIENFQLNNIDLKTIQTWNSSCIYNSKLLITDRGQKHIIIY